MRRRSLGLASLALVGWVGAIAAQAVALGTADGRSAARWTVRRDRFLLLGSVSTNALALSAAYRFIRGLRDSRR